MDRQQANKVIVGVLVGFLIVIGIGTVVIVKLLASASPLPPVGATPPTATPATSATGVTGATPATGAPSTDPDPAVAIDTSHYIVCKPDDASFRVQLPADTTFQFEDTSENVPEGQKIQVLRYIAAGGKASIDGFAVLRFVGYADARSQDQTPDDFLKVVIDRYIQSKGCVAGRTRTVRHPSRSGLRVDGAGVEMDTQKQYFISMEGFVNGNDLILLIAAGYYKSLHTDPAVTEFFESFKLTENE